MKILEENTTGNLPLAATIGMFDGVHRGHRQLISTLQREAAARTFQPALITFRSHPANVLRPEKGVDMLMSLQQRLEAIEAAGIGQVILMDFNRELAALSAKEFMQLLRDCDGVRLLVVGFNHRFGHNRAENFDDYARYGEELGITLIRGEEMQLLGHKVSSSDVRGLLSEGWVESASRMLGHYFTMRGIVVHGFGNGRKIGFPTANIGRLPDHQFIPAKGVYAANVAVNGNRHLGMANIGFRPTFNNGGLSVEVHIIDFDQDIYDCPIEVEFVRMLRPEVKFNSVSDLVTQLNKDKLAIISSVL